MLLYSYLLFLFTFFANISQKVCIFASWNSNIYMEIHFEKEYLSDLYYTAKTSDRKYRFQPDIIKRYIRVVDILEKVEANFRP